MADAKTTGSTNTRRTSTVKPEELNMEQLASRQEDQAQQISELHELAAANQKTLDGIAARLQQMDEKQRREDKAARQASDDADLAADVADEANSLMGKAKKNWKSIAAGTGLLALAGVGAYAANRYRQNQKEETLLEHQDEDTMGITA